MAMSTKKKIENELTALCADLLATDAKLNELASKLMSQQVANLESALDTSRRQDATTRNAAAKYLSDTLTKAKAELSAYITTESFDLFSWIDKRWAAFDFPTRAEPPTHLRVGLLSPRSITLPLPDLPALVPLLNSGNIFAIFPAEHTKAGAQLVSTLVWRLVTAISPAHYRLVLIDSLDLGRNLGALMNLPPTLRGARILCSEEEIRQNLQQIANEIRDTNQNRLLDRYDTVEDYNAANPQTRVPYRFIVLTGFPSGFSTAAIEYVVTIARTGHRAGVYLIAGLLAASRPRDDIPLNQILDSGSTLIMRQPGWIQSDDPAFEGMTIAVDIPPASDLVELFANLASEALAEQGSQLDFGQFTPPLADWWSHSSQAGLSAPIGLDGGSHPLTLEVGPRREAYHALIGGRTGSGKTNFLHSLILTLATLYSDEELELYLVDFKEGVEFQDYAAPQHPLPHARAVVIEAEREFGLSILEHLDSMMEERGRLFKTAGVQVTNIEAYRTQTGIHLPRIIAIFDEFVRLFEFDDHVAEKAHGIMLKLVARGRVFGLHLVLAAQRPIATHRNLNDIKSQISLRVAFKCNEPDDSVLVLGESNDRAASLERSGQAALTYDPTEPARTSTVSVGFVGREDRTLYLRGLHQFGQTHGRHDRPPPIVFSRNAPAWWSESLTIRQALAQEDSISGNPGFWLGQPISLASDVFVPFHAEDANNVLVAGAGRELALSILTSALLGLIVSSAPAMAEFHVLTSPRLASMWTETVTRLQEASPHDIQLIEADQLTATIDELCLRMEHRKTQSDHQRSVYLVVPGLQLFSALTENLGMDDSSAPLGLGRLLSQGPSLRIHTLAWINRSDLMSQVTGSSSNLSHWGRRLVMHVSTDDSVTLLGTPAASRLGTGDKRICYWDMDQPADTATKVKPYELVTGSELERVLEQLRNRWQ